MPVVSNVNLTLRTSSNNNDVDVEVEYDVTFNTFERRLSGLGLNYHSHTTVHDFDGGDTPGAVVLDFFDADDPHRFAVTDGVGDQVFANERESRRVSRASLQVDPVGNDDEFKANVRVHANEMFEAFTRDEISAQDILVG